MLACQVQRKRVPDLGSAEPDRRSPGKEPCLLWYLVILASGRRSEPLWRVLYEWKSHEFGARACSGYIF